MTIFAWGKSDTGRKRQHNEDSLLVSGCGNLDVGASLVAIADGMGGHVGGACASSLAVEVIAREVRAADLDHAPVASVADGGEPAAAVAIREAARAAGRAIYDLAQADPSLKGMGTTLTALLLHRGRGHLAHVGDSRAYLSRDGELRQISEDHSWVQEQAKAGYLTFEETRTSKFRHVITRSVGYEREVKIDVTTFPVLMGDCFLLCSDGLSGPVEEREMSEVLATRWYRDAPAALVDLANEKGGDDNVSVVVAYAANVG
ncbi:MAG: protein phosphatase 2C domain-containing protein [Myxococcota bacterium]